MKLPELAIRRPVFIIVLCLIVTLLGAISYSNIPVDLMPDVSFPRLTVRTSYQGVGPEEMEELVSIPMERALSSTPGIEEISSSSSEGSSQVRIAFAWGTDLDAAMDEIRTRIDRARGQLPDDVEAPTIFKYDVTTFPIMFLGIAGNMNPRDLREFTENQIQYRLERVPGVAQADVYGGLEREIHVKLDRAEMHALRLSPAQVSAALRRENINEPAGQIVEGDFEVLVRTEGEYTSVDQVADTMIVRREGQPIYVRDVAEVEDTHREIRELVRINGVPGIRMAVRKQSGANTVSVATAVKEEVEAINRDLPQTDVFVTYDSSRFIENAVRNVRDAAIYGSVLAVFILLLFLRNFRSTLVIGISIPISVIATFALMYFYGFTLNTVTFGGLALGVGMLVDNAIVVLENIFRHREQGLEKKEAARKGTDEVTLAITASTLTTIVVFIPVIFMSGMSGIMFQQLAWVVSFALFSSLLVSLTLVPLLSSRLIAVREPRQDSWSYRIIHGVGRALESLDDSYARGVNWSLRHRTVVIVATMVVFGSSLLLFPFIGMELQPETDEGELRVDMELPTGTRLEVTDVVARRAEALARKHVPEIEQLMTEVGDQGGFSESRTNTVELRLTLVPEDQRTRISQEIALALRPHFDVFPGVVTRIRTGSGNFMTRLTRGDGDRLSLDVRGYDSLQTYDAAVRLKRVLDATEGVTNARISRGAGRPETRVEINREKGAAMGLTVSDIAANIRTSVGGTTATYFREGGEEYNILVRYAEEDRRQIEDVLAIPIQTPGGRVVPLSSLVQLQRNEGPTVIERKDQQRIVTVYGDLSGTRDMGAIVADLQEELRDFELPPQTAIIFSGEWEEQQEAFQTLLMSLILAIVLVYLVMAAQFESFRFPLLIMFSIPLALIGVIITLFVTDTTFNMQGFIGLIMLAGIVVNNAIVLVDYVLQLQRHHNFSLVDALVTGGRRRLRPILMTTLTTVIGLFPMALGIGEGGEIQAPMARVLIGGLISSTFITLFFIPTLYLTVARFRFAPSEERLPRAAEPSLGS
ncbi:MAG: efflux RND transporter permease subunit [Acidobacteriota bacterium]